MTANHSGSHAGGPGNSYRVQQVLSSNAQRQPTNDRREATAKPSNPFPSGRIWSRNEMRNCLHIANPALLPLRNSLTHPIEAVFDLI
jgi:hypothetical protein